MNGDKKALFVRHLAFGLGAAEIFLGVCLLALVAFIGAAVAPPRGIGAAMVVGIALMAIALPAIVTFLALRAARTWVVYGCLLLLIGYPVTAFGAYAIYG